jgi:hypothetical protein
MLPADCNPDDYERSVETLIPKNIFNEVLEDEDTPSDGGDPSPQSTEAT